MEKYVDGAVVKCRKATDPGIRTETKIEWLTIEVLWTSIISRISKEVGHSDIETREPVCFTKENYSN